MESKKPPQFYVSAACVETLSSPSEFYEALLEAVGKSTQRLTLASLYLGTGSKEQALVDLIRRRLGEQPTLRVHGQFDYSRCLRLARPEPDKPPPLYPSSADLLLRLYEPLGAPVASRVSIGLTRMPAVRGWLGNVVPQRFVEAGGVWHVKAYVADAHTILLSGANLSSDYFTNRQDRYMLIRAPAGRPVSMGGAGRAGAGDEGKPQEKPAQEPAAEGGDGGVAAFAAYLHDLIQSVGSLPGSHVLLPMKSDNGVRGCVTMLDDQSMPVQAQEGVEGEDGAQAGLQEAAGHSRVYVRKIESAREAELDEAFTTALTTHLPTLSHPPGQEDLDPASVPPGMCRVTPRLQCGPTGLRHDEQHTLAVLSNVRPAPQDTLHLVTGYFNVTDSIANGLIGAGGGQGCVHVLTAAPEANGFYGASGPAGAIPLAYSEMEREFLEQAESAGRLMPDPEEHPHAAGVAVHEYQRPGWTFHGKGIWMERALAGGQGKEEKGMVTLVGSPNYGVRSADRDLELQACVVTRDPALVQRLRVERDGLWGRPSGQQALGQRAVSGQGAVPAHVRPVGRHLGPAADVFSHPSRQISGFTWDKGWWIHWGRRVLARFF